MAETAICPQTGRIKGLGAHRIQPVRPGESLEFDVAAIVEHDVPGFADGVAHRFTHQDLAAVGLPATRAAIATLRPNRSSPRRTDLPMWMPIRTRMPLGRLLSARCTSTLHPTGLLGLRERDHEAVALALHHITCVALHVPADQPVVSVDQPDPRPIADAFVESCRLLDIGEQDRDLPLGASRARSGRSTSAQSARSSIDDRTAAPSPSLRMMFAVCQTVLTASRPPDNSMLRVSTRCDLGLATTVPQ